MNTVVIVGNLTEDAELRYTATGSAVANFTVAVSRRVHKDSGWEERTDGFFRCTAWRALAENIADSLKKGTRVLVAGRLEQRSWEDADGAKRSSVEISVAHVGPDLSFVTAQVTKRAQASAEGDPAPVAS